tara:strand:- start:28 stop:390 length:363 start_codon:yes stop_codon:yes gene_type:complete
MRDKKRKEKKLLEEAYGEVYNEMNLGPAAQTASGALGSLGPIVVGVEEDPLAAFEGEECGSHVETDIATLAAQAIAAITELATAAGANLAVTVETEQEEVEDVELPIGPFNTGCEDVEET